MTVGKSQRTIAIALVALAAIAIVWLMARSGGASRSAPIAPAVVPEIASAREEQDLVSSTEGRSAEPSVAGAPSRAAMKAPRKDIVLRPVMVRGRCVDESGHPYDLARARASLEYFHVDAHDDSFSAGDPLTLTLTAEEE